MQKLLEFIGKARAKPVYLEPWEKKGKAISRGRLSFNFKSAAKSIELHKGLERLIAKEGLSKHLEPVRGYSSAGFRARGAVKTLVSIEPKTPRGEKLLRQVAKALK